jgi:hypothetical protein
MTTFTSEDREALEKGLEFFAELKKQQSPPHIVDSGASVDDREDSMQMLRDQIHSQQCEINALRKALMYNKPKELTDEEILESFAFYFGSTLNNKAYNDGAILFAKDILRKAQE